MAKKDDFHKLVGRALVDQEFRAKLRGNKLDEALTSVGIEPTAENKKAVGDAMDSVDNLAQQFGGAPAAT